MTTKLALFDSQHSRDMFLKYLLTGGIVGGTAASGVALMKHLGNIQDRAAQNPKEDEQLLQAAKVAGFMDGGRGDISGPELALAILASAGVGYGSYKGVENIAQRMKRKQVERELSQVQNHYLTEMEGLMPKTAGGDVGGIAQGTAALYVLLALSMGAGGVGAYQALNKNFPKLDPGRATREFEPVSSGKITPISSEDDTGMPRKANEDSLDQSALDEDDRNIPNYSLDTSERVVFASLDAQNEYLLNLILGSEKQAVDSGFRDLVNCVAVGKGEELWKQADSVDELFAKAKAQNDSIDDANITPERKQIAVTVISMHPGMSTALRPVLGAEVNDMSPTMTMIGGSCPCQSRNVMNSLMDTLVGGQRKRILVKLSSKLGSLGIDFTKQASDEPSEFGYTQDCAILAEHLDGLLQSDLI